MIEFIWVDWLILIVVITSCVFGVKRGLIKETLSIVNLVVALAVALSFGDELSYLMGAYVSSELLRKVAAFGTLFIATMVFGALLNFAIGSLIKVVGLSTLDRMLGLLFGFARGVAVVFAVILLTPELAAIEESSWWRDSFLIPNLMMYENLARVSGAELTSIVVQVLENT